MNSILRRISTAYVTPIVLLAIIGFAGWHFASESYENFLGNVAWNLFPQDTVFLALKNHVFSIGLTNTGITTLPQLTLMGHNFGFGLIVTWSIILGTRGRSWILRLSGLFFAWLFLWLTHTGVLVAAAHTYSLAVTQSEVPVGFYVFINSVHPTVTILPVVIILLWLVIPFGMHGTRARQR